MKMMESQLPSARPTEKTRVWEIWEARLGVQHHSQRSVRGISIASLNRLRALDGSKTSWIATSEVTGTVSQLSKDNTSVDAWPGCGKPDPLLHPLFNMFFL